jgi:hypothetical protein
VIIAGAGGAAHLPGMVAAMTHLPVLGVPVESKALKGQDSLLSIVQMPAGIPVGTLAIGEAGGDQRRAARRSDPRHLRPRARRAPARVPCRADRRGGRDPARRMIAPGSTIGILGGGQLGRMLAMAAAQLGYRCHVYSPEKDSVAAEVSAKFTCSEWHDRAALSAFAQDCAVVTYEFENVPVAPLGRDPGPGLLAPGTAALRESAQDRLSEKRFVEELGGRPACVRRPVSPTTSCQAGDRARRHCRHPQDRVATGYDGKGQVAHRLGERGRGLRGSPSTAGPTKGLVRFEAEFSVILVRGRDGRVRFWDSPQTSTRAGFSPARRCRPAAIVGEQARRSAQARARGRRSARLRRGC